MCYNRHSKVMHIFYAQKISLHEYLHESGLHLSAEEKFTIAKNIAHGLKSLHENHTPPAHTHLSSKNIMLNPSDLHIHISDYNLKSLKKFAKVCSKYENTNAWSATEIWADPNNEFHDMPSVDAFSYGMLLWEIETGKIPFEGLSNKDLRNKLVEEKMRPQIPK